MHGYVAVVLPVSRDGVRYALKVSWVDDSSRDEALALRLWDGRGAVRLVDADAGMGALLLEWLDPGRSLMDPPPDEAAAVAGELLHALRVPGPTTLRSVGEEVGRLGAALRARWETAGRPCPEAWVDWAVGWALDQGDAGRAEDRIVNQDLHYENVLAGGREPWLVIDPKPLRGPAEFGVAPLLWNRDRRFRSGAEVERRVRIVAEAGRMDAALASAWSRWRLIEAGLWASEEADPDFAARVFRLAGWLDAVVP